MPAAGPLRHLACCFRGGFTPAVLSAPRRSARSSPAAVVAAAIARGAVIAAAITGAVAAPVSAVIAARIMPVPGLVRGDAGDQRCCSVPPPAPSSSVLPQLVEPSGFWQPPSNRAAERPAAVKRRVGMVGNLL